MIDPRLDRLIEEAEARGDFAESDRLWSLMLTDFARRALHEKPRFKRFRSNKMNKDLEQRIDRALMRRDFAEVDRLMALRLRKDDDPLVKGGQGRSEQELLDDGSYLVFLCVVAVAMAAGVGIWALLGWVLSW